MPIVYRSEKGAPLTRDEVDNNFRELDQRIEKLTSSTYQTEGIGDIQVHGDRLTIIGNRGAKFGPFKLPVVGYTPRGAWAAGRDYAIYDVVSQQGNAYVCSTAHFGQNFEQEQKHWQLLFQAVAPSQQTVGSKEDLSTSAPQLRVYEPNTLPKTGTLGQLALYVNEQNTLNVIFGDGKGWRFVATGEGV